MRIEIVGTRGIPARYGGFETCVEETATRLVQWGHEVRVHCRRRPGQIQPATYQGVQLSYHRPPQQKYLHTLSHTFLSTLDVVRRQPEVIHLYSVGNSLLLPLLRLSGARVCVSVDGLDWKRSKWNRAAQRYLRLAERLAVQFAHEVIVDSQVIAEYYRQHYGTQTRYIPYGARLDVPAETDVLERLGLSPFRYLLFVGRLTPEKQVHHLVEAYAGITTEFPLVIVGDDPFSREYITRLKSMAPPGVRFAGLIYDAGFRQLCANAYLYCTPSAIEGTSPALLGAMGMGACPLVNGIPENLETIGNAGFSYRANDVTDLCQQLQRLLAEPDRVRQTGRRARERVAQWYSWDTATRQLEAVYRGMEEREPRLRPMG